MKVSQAEVYFFLANLSEAISLLPLVIVIFRIKCIKSALVPLASLTFISAVCELLNESLTQYSENNLPVFRIYTLIEFFLLSLFYTLFYKQYSIKTHVLFLAILFIFVFIVDYIINGLMHFDNYATAFEALTFSILSLWSFLFIVRKMIFENLTAEPFFWINMGVLLYFGGNLVLFVFNDYILKYEYSNQPAFWTIHSVLNILYNIILAVGFWKTKRP